MVVVFAAVVAVMVAVGLVAVMAVGGREAKVAASVSTATGRDTSRASVRRHLVLFLVRVVVVTTTISQTSLPHIWEQLCVG